MPTVVVFSHDPILRDQVRLAIGRRPSQELESVDFVDVEHSVELTAVLNKGDVDLLILDGEAKPEGGLGLARQVKDEVAGAPPVLLILARSADKWLARWSKAEGSVLIPLDPAVVAAEAVRLLVLSARREPVAPRKGLFGFPLKARP